MASVISVVNDTATLEEVIDVLQEHALIRIEGDFECGNITSALCE